MHAVTSATFKHFRSLLFPLFPAVRGIGVTQPLALVSNGRAVPSPSLSGVEQTVPHCLHLSVP